jgi:CubicO group peptidase (beta-lactamase class C family)
MKNNLRTLILGAVFAVFASSAHSQAAAPATGKPDPVSLLSLTQPQELEVFKTIEQHYDTRTVKRGSHVHPLPVAAKQIAPVIHLDGRDYDVDAFMQHAYMTGVLVLKDGQIALERYASGRTANDRWTSFSVAKSVTSTLVGFAIKDGYIRNVDELVTKYLPDLKGSGYDGVTIRQLLTMTSGVKWNEDYADPKSDVAQSSFWRGPAGKSSLVDYMRRLPRQSEPGTEFVYKTGETDLVGLLVAQATHKSLSKYATEKLWKPYGMEQDAVWMVDRDGHERGGCCISMTLHDYARVGLFIADGGKIDGKLRLPADWLAQATTNQLKPPAKGDYGYFWWTRADGFDARGIFGQGIMFYPAEHLVIAVNGATPLAVSKDYAPGRAAFVAAIREAAR